MACYGDSFTLLLYYTDVAIIITVVLCVIKYIF
jgi:hypothetical protein